MIYLRTAITINNFKNYILKELEPETYEYYHVWELRVGVIGESLCLLMPSVSSDIDDFGIVQLSNWGFQFLVK